MEILSFVGQERTVDMKVEVARLRGCEGGWYRRRRGWWSRIRKVDLGALAIEGRTRVAAMLKMVRR